MMKKRRKTVLIIRNCFHENMNKVEIKLFFKKIVTNSDFLSSIRRKYRLIRISKNFRNMKKSFSNTSYPRDIEKYKGIHNGEKCFIIGNGPSLKAEDLEKLYATDTDSFAFNRVYLIYDKTNWRPAYYMCQDRNLIQALKDHYSTCKEKVFLGYQAKFEYGIDVPEATYYLCDNRTCNDLVSSLDFSSDASQVVIDGASVTYSAIQMAVYMGYKEIYLLGVDHNFSHTLDKNRRIVEHKEVKNDYFDSRYKDAFKRFEEKGKTYAAPDKEMIETAFKSAKKYCDNNGIKILNATRGGKLEVFERIEFDKIWEI